MRLALCLLLSCFASAALCAGATAQSTGEKAADSVATPNAVNITADSSAGNSTTAQAPTTSRTATLAPSNATASATDSDTPATSSDPPPPTTTKRNGAEIYLANLNLIDHDGRHIDLYRDLIKGRTIILHSFFARCEGSCPVMMSTLKAIQTRLGDQLNRDVHIVSITVDPTHDTPAVLAEYAKRVQAKPGWHFLSGKPDDVSNALRRLGQYADAPENHLNLIVVGNDATGDWTKVHGLAGKEVLGAVEKAAGASR